MRRYLIEETGSGLYQINGEVVGSGADVYWTLAAMDDRAVPLVYLPGDLAAAGDRDLTGEAVDLQTACDYFQPFVSGGDA